MRETDLDRLLTEARMAPLAPSGDFLARMEAAALAEQPRPAPPAVTPFAAPAGRGPGLWAALSAAFGGAGVMASLGGAAALGLMLGYASPDTLGWLTNGYLSSSAGMEIVPVAEVFLSEG